VGVKCVIAFYSRLAKEVVEMNKLEVYKDIIRKRYESLSEDKVEEFARLKIRQDEESEDAYCKEHDC
jgi:hypothetical protein